MDTPKTQELWLEHVHFANKEEAAEALCDFRDLCSKFERENNALKTLLREALPTIDADMADAWKTGLKQQIESALANAEVTGAKRSLE